jgi:hypothetical protein
MDVATVEWVYPADGQALDIGAKLLDLTVDLSAAAPHDCPPISHYRLVLRERVWLRRLMAGRHDVAAVGAQLAVFATEADEPLHTEPSRPLRVAIAAIIHQPSWDWS